MSSLKKLAIRGAVWTFIGYGLSQGLRFISNLILTRLLVPELFGLMALVNTFIIGLTLFSDIGINPSIIQNKRGDDPDFLNTAWTIQVIRGFGLWFACLLIAWPVAHVYGDSRLLWLIPILGLNTIVSGFNSTNIPTLNRHMEIGKLTLLELGVQIITLTVMNVWAWLNPTIWALVGGTLVSGIVKMIWSHRLIPEMINRFTWDKTAIQEIFSFGRWIFMSTAMTFLSDQSDKLILGKLFSLQMLGVYTIAFTLADIPRQISIKLGNSVIFPVISKQLDLPRQTLRVKILQKRRLILLGAGILLIVMVSCGDFLILALYDERYKQAAWMMPILSLALWHTLLYNTMSPALIAVGKPLYGAQGNVLRFLTLVVGLPLGFSLFGILGAVLVVAFSDVPLYLVMMYGLWREGLSCIGEDIKVTTLFIGCLSIVLIGRYLLGFNLPIADIL
ncbi:MAG TPA: polysaccharide biosynthesis protein [Cyanobacteria bacterium UBA11149]|nr:polysaccharide biosynthesis protein [Cyanobacteria bacterium UBA11367]HBE57023.1 polysaccharide biosynthesis protein [Cyanobacteria bacterium UBA11366]HBK66750.1 polysaccharide biosynthesis protein [Cyanobacteria bacterium UBA11166]HBR73047.1 polysaccharide biosynthesis protein [Cyanobacteria bacterium UBA11159]HBS72738.1 polysaccharide biosynthesis protein [Cyanobacteria bacterium UBA11153]HBW88860.1 polysaccharide biosynthesis protein [Cyanobacteria bacterium UBA11149]HCA97023.1 polysacc